MYETFPGTGFNSQLVARDSVELAYSMSGRGPIEGPCLSEGSELSDFPKPYWLKTTSTLAKAFTHLLCTLLEAWLVSALVSAHLDSRSALNASRAKTQFVEHLDLEYHLDFDLGDLDRSFAGSANRELKDP